VLTPANNSYVAAASSFGLEFLERWFLGQGAMIRPKQPVREASIRRAGNIVLAFPLAVGAALVVWKYSIWRVLGQNLGIGFLVVSFIVFFVLFYSVLQWFWNRRAELAKTLPTSSKELSRRRKAFYDWLASQGRND